MPSPGKQKLNQSVEEDEEKVFECKIEDYDTTFAVAKKILIGMGLPMPVTDNNPVKKLFWNIVFWFHYANLVIAGILEFTNTMVMAAHGTFFNLFTMMPCVGYLIVALLKAYKMKRNRHVFENLIDEPRTMWPTGRVSEDVYRITTDGAARIRLFVRVYSMCNFVLGFLFVGQPLMTLVKWITGADVEPVLPFLYWLPYDLKKNHRYEITFAIQVYHSFSSVYCMVIGDLLFCSYLNHITTQFSLLGLRINRLFFVTIDSQLVESYPLAECSNKLLLEEQENFYYSKKREDWLNREIVSIVQRHWTLIRLAGDVEKMYTFSLLVNFMNSSVIICFCLFCCAFIEKWNEFSYKLFLSTTVMQIWVLCWYGQQLLDTSTGVGEALYNCGWYMASKGVKKSIYIMLQRCRSPVYITAYGFSIISLENFAAIMKTSWSYFTLLINVYAED